MSEIIKIPGTELEKAVAGGISGAAKTLTDAFGGLLQRWAVRGNMRAQAEAENIAANIRQEGDLRRSRIARTHERDQALVDAEWLAKVTRAVGRFQSELLREQDNVEIIADQSLLLANSDPDREKTKALDDDWLLRFFQYAAKVDDAQLQAVMARALADAAIADRPVISHRAIDTIRFLERQSYRAFGFAARELTRFGAVPRGYFSLKHLAMPEEFDLSNLMEIELVKSERHKSTDLQIGPVSFLLTFAPRETFAFELISLTQIGREIAALMIPEVRERFGMGLPRALGQKVWTIQCALGLDAENVRSAAVATVQEASDGWALAIEVYQRELDGSTRTLFGGSRDAIENPFGITDLAVDGPQDDRRVNDLVQIVVNEFRHFDEHQLPNLVSEPFVTGEYTKDVSRSG